MRLLDINDCPDHLLESVSLTEEEYQYLLESRALEKINNTIGKIIDEYEDDTITIPQELKESLQILKTHLNPKNSKALNKIIHLNKLALNIKTGLFFFF